MSKNPVNLVIRFILEVGAVLSFGIWGFRLSAIWTQYLFVILLPLMFALIWGVFAVKNDPSRSGKTVVSTSGLIRLIIELGLFGAATWMMFDLDFVILGWIYGAVVLLHYVISFDRIGWLLKQK